MIRITPAALLAVLLCQSVIADEGGKKAQQEKSIVFEADNADAKIQMAYKLARKNFRYFWREASMENHRIIPGLSMSAVKAPFTDGPKKYVEHMWMNEIEFDGENITGVIVNSPNQVTKYKRGDRATIKLNEISDWMYAYGEDEVYGGYTIQAIRLGMNERERASHDKMWGMDFGDPNKVAVCPNFGKKDKDGKKTFDPQAEHTMAKNLTPKIREYLKANPKHLNEKNKKGLTMLHAMAINGSTSTVELLLELGADTKIKTKSGKTAYELAKSAGWTKVTKLLTPKK